MKKIISYLIIMMMLVSLVAGCSNNGEEKDSTGSQEEGKAIEAVQADEQPNFNETGLPIVNEPVTYQVMTKQSPVSKKAMVEKPIFAKMEEDTNIKIEWEEIVDTAWKEKFNIALNSRDLPDAMLTGDDKDILKLPEAIEAGLLLAWDDYTDLTPQLLKLYEAYPISEKASTYLGDGKHYFYPAVEQKEFANLRAPLFINTQWLDVLGLEMPTTTDQFYEVLKAFKEGDPNGNGDTTDEIPICSDKAGFGYSLMESFGPFDIMSMQNPAKTTIRDGKLDFNPVNENFRDALEYHHKLYSEGLVEPEAFTMDGKTKWAKAGQEPPIYGAFLNWDNSMGGPSMDQYEAVPPLIGPNGAQKFEYNDTNKVNISMVIFNDCENPKPLIRWMDYLNTGENAIAVFAGVKGVGWYIDETTKEWYSRDEELKAEGTTFAEHRVTEGVHSVLGSTAVSGYKMGIPENSSKANKHRWSEMYRPYFFKEYYPKSMPMEIPTEESKEVAILWEDLDAYVKAFVADAIINGLTDDSWETHVKQCEDLQYEKIVAFYQEKYDRVK